jgi:hypothetical protein
MERSDKIQPPTERIIPEDRFISLEEVLSETVDELELYVVVEDLVSAIIFTKLDIRRQYLSAVLNHVMQTKVDVFTSTSAEQIKAYVTFNGIEDGFFFVNSYPNDPNDIIENPPTEEELDAFLKFLPKDNLDFI